MQIDYTSLLIALAFSSFAILVAALASWSSARKDHYLILDAVGVSLLMVALILLGVNEGNYVFETLIMPFTLMHLSAAFIYAGTRLFLGKSDMRPVIAVGAVTTLLTGTAMFSGLLGLGSITLNIGFGFVLVLCAAEYASFRHEFRSAITANIVLYSITGLSFVGPAVPVAFSGDMVTYPPVDTLMDTINAGVGVIGITGIGALTLMLHFSRVARKHYVDAHTDPLTGVLNRRGVFERFNADGAIPGRAVLLFDLDNFKIINDQLGHGQGDQTLRKFGEFLHLQFGTDAVLARIGGEEFCVILTASDAAQARELAEDARIGFASLCLPGGHDGSVATVSIGLATGGSDESFESVLSRADAALYKAKSAGRNKLYTDRAALAV